RTAALCLRRTLQLNPLSIPATGLMANLLEAAGSPMAVGWRMRLSQLLPNDGKVRLDWAQTALKLHDSRPRAAALEGAEAKVKNSAVYHKLAGALVWAGGKSQEARAHYEEALRLEPQNQTVLLNLATVDLTSTNSLQADQARATLERMS